MIKPKPLRPAVDGGFTLDEDQGTVTCPAGQVRPMSKAYPRYHSRISRPHSSPANSGYSEAS